MGEVYRARDTRLDRTVAIKVLPDRLASDPEAKQRLDREARAISALSHPNICHLYDVGQEEGVSYLVMEYLEGETLGDRLHRGKLPLEQMFRVSVEICQGLEQAHRSGVIHRDLKPGNIMLTKSGAKLMDFGLAKAQAAPLGNVPASNTLATMSQPLTTEGTIVGTIQYMAPEQLEGKEADKRSDIFALGSVLYEMVTGKRAFEGKTTASTIAAILAAEPKPLSAVQPLSPPALEHVIATCIAKDPDERWQNCADISRQLEWVAKAPKTAEPSPRSRKLLWMLPAAALLIAAAFWLGMRWSKVPARVSQFEVYPPSSTYFNFRGLSGVPVPSPDGSRVAFVAFKQGKSGTAGLWLRSLESTESRFLPGTEGAIYPFWSPGGKFLAFFAGGRLKKLEVSGGSVTPICDVMEGRGGTWSTEGVIIFGVRAGALFRVDASGGKPVRLTTLDDARHEVSHRFPHFFPDQKHFLFVAQAPQITASVFVASLDSPRPVMLEDVTSSAMFSNNHLLYVVDNNLMARGFDPGTMRFTSEPVVVAEHVQNDPQFNFAAFSVSASTLIYQTGAVAPGTRLVSYDRSGKQTVLSEERDLLQTVVLSPKEDQLAASLGLSSGQLNDIWVFDLRKNTKAKLTFDQHSFSPVWSPDGKKLAFDRIDADGETIVAKDVSGSGAEEILFKRPFQKEKAGGEIVLQELYPIGWTPDGRYLIYRDPREVSALALDGSRKTTHLLPANQATLLGVEVSPDGRWLAYSSNESSLSEIYVVPFHAALDGTPTIKGGKWQVSNGGGIAPVWRRDGKELFFTHSSASTLMSASISIAGDHFQSDKPQSLFDVDAHPIVNYYTVTRDGQKIYMTSYGPGSTAPFTVTTNWLDLVKK